MSLSGSFEHPCHGSNLQNSKCCNSTFGFDKNLKSIMKVMRFASNRAKSQFTLKSISNRLEETPPYNLRIKDMVDVNAMIPKCFMKQFEGEPDAIDLECELFQPTITDMGICPSFNSMQMTEVLEPSYFLDSYMEAYKEDFANHSTIKFGEEFGQSLNLYLVTIPKEIKNEITAQKPATFNLAITSSKEFFGMKTSSFKIKAGYKSIIEVEPMEIAASEDLKGVPLDKRKCKFDDEIDGLKLFKSYSQSACQFEMKLRKGLETCKCVPWYIPTDLGSKYTICDPYGNVCFDLATKSSETFKNCVPNCNLAQFSRNLILEKIDTHEVCRDESGWNEIASKIYHDKGIYLLFKTQKLNQWFYDEHNESYVDTKAARLSFCENMAKYFMAEVVVKFSNKKYIKTKMDVKVSFSDRLGVFGTYDKSFFFL